MRQLVAWHIYRQRIPLLPRIPPIEVKIQFRYNLSRFRLSKGFKQSALAGRLDEFSLVRDQERPLSSWSLARGYTPIRQTCWPAAFASVWTILLYFLWVGSWFPVLRLRKDLGKSRGRRSLLHSSNSRFCVCNVTRSRFLLVWNRPRTGRTPGSLQPTIFWGLGVLAVPFLKFLAQELQAYVIQFL